MAVLTDLRLIAGHVKKYLLILLLGLLPLAGMSSHIVGGEFELIHVTGFQYRLNMILYFDEINGTPGAKDDNGVTVYAFRSFDNALMRSIHLPYINEALVQYTQPSCSNGELVTSRLFYTTLVTLDPNVFNHPDGYYIAWERCCRNYTISNIFSQVPNPGAQYAGQTFYLEFPPVVKDGQPFVDSTPRLFPPLNDYACPYRPYYADFGGVDDDGDSLVYSLVTPLSTRTGDALPAPGPRPYPNVVWRPPYGPTNVLNGNPDLRISRDGFLTVTPTTQGLFVFAVKVEEFRDQVKIGETRRDFQMLVVDACPIAEPPKILGKKLGDASYTYDEVMNVFFSTSVADEDRCIQVRVSDPDSESIQDLYQERVRIKAVAMNFNANLSGILPTVSEATLISGSTVEFTVCFPKCPFLFGGTPEIGIVAMDDACSLPLTDTLKVLVDVQAPPNTKPRFTSINPITATLTEGSQQAWPYAVVDDDGDPLVISVLTNGFSLTTAGMQFETFNQVDGAANGQLKWDAYCDIYDFTKRTAFQVTIQVEDMDECLLPDPARAIHNLNVILPGNADPIIDSDLTANPAERTVTGITRRINEPLTFTVTGKDLTDNDLLVLSSEGQNLRPGTTGLAFTPSPAQGNGTVSTVVQWNLACDDVPLTDKHDQADMNLRFIVVDNANKCRIYKADTLDVEVKVLPPLNQPPLLTMINNNPAQTELSGGVLTVTRGAAIDLLFTGTDANVVPPDKLSLRFTEAEGDPLPNNRFSFIPVEGTSPVTTNFTWTPDCSIFRGGDFENEYRLTFRLKDDHCLTEAEDSVTVTVRVSDVDGSDAGFQPPNFVSPNGDDKNDYYAMEQLVPETGELRNILPNDNCVSRFEYVRIYNRWGKEMYRSTDRDFKWFPSDTAPGVYYYSIKFTEKEYRGALTIAY